MTKFAALYLVMVATTPVLPLNVLAQSRPELRPNQMADLVAVELRADPENPQPGQVVRAILTLRNQATHAQERVPVALFAGAVRVATTIVRIPAGAIETVPLSWTAERAGAYALRQSAAHLQWIIVHWVLDEPADRTRLQ